MPRRPTNYNPPLEKAFICAQCTRKFRSKTGRIRHINAKHGGLRIKSPQSAEDDNFHETSSRPGFPSPTPPSHFDMPSLAHNSDVFDFGDNDFNFNNNDTIPSPSQDTASNVYRIPPLS